MSDSVNSLVSGFYRLSDKEDFAAEPVSFFKDVQCAESESERSLKSLRSYRTELGSLCKNLVNNYSINFWEETSANIEVLRKLRVTLHFHREVSGFINRAYSNSKELLVDTKFSTKINLLTSRLVHSLREGHVHDVCKNLRNLKAYLSSTSANELDQLIKAHERVSILPLEDLRVYSLGLYLMIRDGLIGAAETFLALCLFVNMYSREKKGLGGYYFKGAITQWIELSVLGVAVGYLLDLGSKNLSDGYKSLCFKIGSFAARILELYNPINNSSFIVGGVLSFEYFREMYGWLLSFFKDNKPDALLGVFK